jgi:hypothetical protein
MQIIVNQSDLGSLAQWAQTAAANPEYQGTVNIGGTDTNGNAVSLSLAPPVFVASQE